jgi:DNA polymerase III subunit gamma/tau
LTEAWGDGVLRSLPAKVKALYSAGRFVAFDDAGAQFALPTQPHRDRCAELAPQVEAALAAHFGTPVSLTLVVDESGPAPVSHSREGGSRDSVSRRARQAAADDDMVDPEELIAATQGDTDVQAAAEAKLLEAFPGAEVS